MIVGYGIKLNVTSAGGYGGGGGDNRDNRDNRGARMGYAGRDGRNREYDRRSGTGRSVMSGVILHRNMQANQVVAVTPPDNARLCED